MVFRDVFVDDDGDLREGLEFGRRARRAVRVGGKAFHLGFDDVVDLLVLDLEDEFGEVEGFDVDAVFLKGDLIETGGLEGGGSRADRAEVEALHAIDYAANRGKIHEVFLEDVGEGMHDVGFHDGEGNLSLGEDVRDGEFSAEGVAAMGEIHFADLVGIGLEENRGSGIAQSFEGAVFVRENRHGEDDAVIFSFVLLEPVVIEAALVASLNPAVTGRGFFHDDVVVTGSGHGFDHVLAGIEDEFAGHEAAVAKA